MTKKIVIDKKFSATPGKKKAANFTPLVKESTLSKRHYRKISQVSSPPKRQVKVTKI